MEVILLLVALAFAAPLGLFLAPVLMVAAPLIMVWAGIHYLTRKMREKRRAVKPVESNRHVMSMDENNFHPAH
ncbi:MAG: hypothetical protein MJA83_18190 [Gammaproteobacteria bacterium]|nr:hypothetical protein [Gammaproteobacteria bacterium]